VTPSVARRSATGYPREMMLASTALLLWSLGVSHAAASAPPASCPGLIPGLGLKPELNAGFNTTDVHNTGGALSGCCIACAKAGPAGCEAVFTGPGHKLCVLYPAGSVAGVLKSPGHFSAFHGAVPSPRPAPSHFPGGSVDQKLVVLSQEEADQYGAKCLDGSPPAVYYAPARGVENQDNWVLYFVRDPPTSPFSCPPAFALVRKLGWRAISSVSAPS
jgi:hypothetical protein